MTKQSRLFQEIQDDFRLTCDKTGQHSLESKIKKAMTQVPRENFIEANLKEFAYINEPLGIGHGQTISQPFIVALMTQMLDLQKHHQVLEIGTGTGYQTAILAQLAGHVTTIEIVKELQNSAAIRLKQLNIDNVTCLLDDGANGYIKNAPYDRIVITAATTEISDELISQLKIGGIIIAPIGEVGTVQTLMKIIKTKNGLDWQEIIPVRFVPLTH